MTETTLTFEEKAASAYKSEGCWIEEFEIDGIRYVCRAFTYMDFNEDLIVAWILEYRDSRFQVTAHYGQQSILGFKEDIGFNEDCYCNKCATNPEEYWAIMERYWNEEMKAYGVTWNPELTF